jgi:GGDEF domain-containing protein
VRASLGYACGLPEQHAAAMAAADAALYRAKAAGGDCVYGSD